MHFCLSGFLLSFCRNLGKELSYDFRPHGLFRQYIEYSTYAFREGS